MDRKSPTWWQDVLGDDVPDERTWSREDLWKELTFMWDAFEQACNRIGQYERRISPTARGETSKIKDEIKLMCTKRQAEEKDND